MTPVWLQQKERGVYFAYRVLIWLALQLGRTFARILIFPVCAYFIAFSSKTTKGSRLYLRRVLGRPAGVSDVFRHHRCFAATILDRIYLLTDQYQLFDIRMHGDEELIKRVVHRQGCLFLGSHLGSFEIVRACGLKLLNRTEDLTVKMIMHQDNAQNLARVFSMLNPSLTNHIISIGAPDAMLRAKEGLDAGELLGILADRPVKDEKLVTCRFFDRDVGFPVGPMLLASVLKVPVLLFFGLYRGGKRYDVYFELFAESVKIDRTARESDLQRWMQLYVNRLEYFCRLAPYNWFNFYDYWNENS